MADFSPLAPLTTHQAIVQQIASLPIGAGMLWSHTSPSSFKEAIRQAPTLATLAGAYTPLNVREVRQLHATIPSTVIEAFPSYPYGLLLREETSFQNDIIGILQCDPQVNEIMMDEDALTFTQQYLLMRALDCNVKKITNDDGSITQDPHLGSHIKVIYPSTDILISYTTDIRHHINLWVEENLDPNKLITTLRNNNLLTLLNLPQEAVFHFEGILKRFPYYPYELLFTVEDHAFQQKVLSILFRTMPDDEVGQLYKTLQTADPTRSRLLAEAILCANTYHYLGDQPSIPSESFKQIYAYAKGWAAIRLQSGRLTEWSYTHPETQKGLRIVYETERLNLVSLTTEMTPFMQYLMANEQTMAMFGNGLPRQLLRVGDWQTQFLIKRFEDGLPNSCFIATEKGANRMLGFINLGLDDEVGSLALGIAFIPDAWNKRYAFEALSTILKMHTEEILTRGYTFSWDQELTDQQRTDLAKTLGANALTTTKVEVKAPPKCVNATFSYGNTASLKLFKSLGFKSVTWPGENIPTFGTLSTIPQDHKGPFYLPDPEGPDRLIAMTMSGFGSYKCYFTWPIPMEASMA